MMTEGVIDFLKTTAKKIKQVVRKSDLVARLGGDEFAIILYDMNNNQIDAFAKRVLTQIEQRISSVKKELFVTASVGISLYPDNGHLADTLVKAADTAMYQSKNRGKNRFTRIQTTKYMPTI